MGFEEVEKLRNEKLTISKKIANVTKTNKNQKKIDATHFKFNRNHQLISPLLTWIFCFLGRI